MSSDDFWQTPVAMVSELHFEIETAVERPGLASTIELRNFSSAHYDIVDGRIAPTTFAPLTVILAASANNYISPDMDVEARLTWNPINDESPAQDGWRHIISSAVWRASP